MCRRRNVSGRRYANISDFHSCPADRGTTFSRNIAFTFGRTNWSDEEGSALRTATKIAVIVTHATPATATLLATFFPARTNPARRGESDSTISTGGGGSPQRTSSGRIIKIRARTDVCMPIIEGRFMGVDVCFSSYCSRNQESFLLTIHAIYRLCGGSFFSMLGLEGFPAYCHAISKICRWVSATSLLSMMTPNMSCALRAAAPKEQMATL